MRDGPAPETVFGEQIAARLAVRGVGRGPIDVQMVTPAGQLQPVVPERLGLLDQLGER